MELEIRHLRLIHALAEEGTQTRAARRLFLTQSALSHQLTDLERRVGTELFHRVGRRLTLTRGGRRVLEASEAIMPQLSELTTDLRAIASGVTGQIRVTTQCYTCYNWLPRILPRFKERYPGVEVQLVPEAAHRVVASVVDGEVDVALAYDFDSCEGSMTVSEDALEATDLWVDELVAIVHPEHPFAGRDHVTAADFADEHYLTHSDQYEETYFHRAVLDPARVKPKKVSSLRLTEGIVAMVRAGVGVAVFTRWPVARELADGQLVGVRITERGLRRQWQAIRLPSKSPDYPSQYFIELLHGGPIHLFDAPGEDRLFATTGVAVS